MNLTPPIYSCSCAYPFGDRSIDRDKTRGRREEAQRRGRPVEAHQRAAQDDPRTDALGPKEIVSARKLWVRKSFQLGVLEAR